MAGDVPGGGADDEPCPLCGGVGGAVGSVPARVTLAKRRIPAEGVAVARAGPRDEASAALRRGIAELQEELEAERCAAAGAASEAMSMILRLQRDKSEAMMEARQYSRYAEERFAHDAAEVAALHDALERRDTAVRSLSAQLRACRARLLHVGFPSPSSLPSSPTALGRGLRDHHHPFADDDDDSDGGGYPSVRCLDHPGPADVGTPRTHHLLNRMPGQEDDDKGLVCVGSPRHSRALSGDSFSYNCGVALADEFPFFADQGAPVRDEESDDRVYTVDAVHGVPMMAAPWAEEEEIQKLKARLQALEADRESMRHAIMSMGDEKAQVVLLREIAQQLCKETAPFRAVPLKVRPWPQPVVVSERKVVKRPPFFLKVFILTVIKWFASIFCWRRKSNRIKYPIGLCGSNVGLMLVLDRYPKQRRRRFLKRS